MSDISGHTYIHTEAQLVWNRFNAMMVAHSIILGVLGTKIGETANQNYEILVLIGSSIGVLLTYLWWALTSLGWSLQEAWIKGTNSPTSDPNGTLGVYNSWKMQLLHHIGQHDIIWWCAHAIIWVFLVIYLAIAYFGATRVWPGYTSLQIGVPVALLLPLFVVRVVVWLLQLHPIEQSTCK